MAAKQDGMKNITVAVPMEGWLELQRLVLEEKAKGNTNYNISSLVREALEKHTGVKLDTKPWGRQ